LPINHLQIALSKMSLMVLLVAFTAEVGWLCRC